MNLEKIHKPENVRHDEIAQIGNVSFGMFTDGINDRRAILVHYRCGAPHFYAINQTPVTVDQYRTASAAFNAWWAGQPRIINDKTPAHAFTAGYLAGLEHDKR